MSIWFQQPALSDDAASSLGPMAEHLGVRIAEIGDDFIKATMPVDDRTRQPMGLLHGGASVFLAETLGSVAANLVVDPARFVCVGLEINANHVRAVRHGKVIGTVRPVHVGRSTQVWQIEIHDEKNRLVCLSRITLSVLDRSS